MMRRRTRADRTRVPPLGTPAFDAILAERERALGLDAPNNSDNSDNSDHEPELAPPAAASPVSTHSAVPLATRLDDRARHTRRILIWGEAHGWPHLPLARTRRGVYASLIAGEAGWRTFVLANHTDILRLAILAIEEADKRSPGTR